MPPNYRITLLMGKVLGDPVGHSERWDFNVSSDSLAVSLANKLVARRAGFMPQDWQIVIARVASIAPFHTVSHGWRFKATSVAFCNPANVQGQISGGEIDGGAMYYRFHYANKPGKASVRLFTPIPESWWSGTGSTGKGVQSQADAEIQPFIRWLIANGHQLSTIDKNTGTPTFYTLECGQFQRAAIKRIGRPFLLRRGRRFAHRTPRP